MELHDEAVIQTHARHLCQHLCPKQLRVLGADVWLDDAAEQSLCSGAVEIGRPGRWVAVIACGSTPRLEVVAAGPVGLKVAAPSHASAGCRDKGLHVRGKSRAAGVGDCVGTVGRNYSAAPS